jgi:hypothetical protein
MSISEPGAKDRSLDAVLKGLCAIAHALLEREPLAPPSKAKRRRLRA